MKRTMKSVLPIIMMGEAMGAASLPRASSGGNRIGRQFFDVNKNGMVINTDHAKSALTKTERVKRKRQKAARKFKRHQRRLNR